VGIGNSGLRRNVETDAMTRRTAIFVSLGLPAAFESISAWAAAEFWNEKKPENWTPEEIRELLTKSPWAKEPSVNYNAGPGNAGRPSGNAGSYGRRTRSTVPGSASPGGTSIEKQQYKVVARWEALPIRIAAHSQSTDDPLANYVINMIGDLPMLGTHNDETATEREQRAEGLKEYTKLERKNDPIYLSKVIFQNATETLFYFPRLEPIFPDDKQVTFTTKLGPLEVKAKFTLKEMVYQGKLEL
jgi:hypothetical protein